MNKLRFFLFLFLYFALLGFALDIGRSGYFLFKKHSVQKRVSVAQRNPEAAKRVPTPPVFKEEFFESDSKTVSEDHPIQKESTQPEENVSARERPADPDVTNRSAETEAKPAADNNLVGSIEKETDVPLAEGNAVEEIVAKPTEENGARLDITPATNEKSSIGQREPTIVPVPLEIKLLVSPVPPETNKNGIVPVELERKEVVKSKTEESIPQEIQPLVETPPVQNEPVVSTQSAPEETKIASAQSSSLEVKSPPSDKYPPNPTSDRSSPPLLPKFISIRHVWGDQETECIPFATNYTTLEMLFASNYKLGSIMPMMDLRGHRFDDNTYAANVGLGGRYIPNPDYDYLTEILGFNAYYDYRQGYIGYYNQIGAGIEILSKRWDFRANAYVPFGPKCHMDTTIYTCYTTDYYLIRRSVESISYSFNAEVGCLLFDINDLFSLYAAGGPYFIARAIRNGGVVGGEARLRPKYKDFMALDLSWRYDHLFGTIWQIDVILNIPLYQIRGKNRSLNNIKNWQIYQPIERFEVMPLSLQNCWQSNF